MANFFKDNDDLRYYFDRGIDWDALVKATERGSAPSSDAPKSVEEAKALYREIAEMVGEFVAEEIAPHTKQIDHEKVRYEKGEAVFPPLLASVFEKIRAMELHGLALPRELGGMNAPLSLYFLLSEMFARADVSVMAHHGFHGGMAAAMMMFSIREGTTEFDPATGAIDKTRFAKEIREIIEGKAWGCMDITEPDAGSDMARLRAKGELGADGVWRVTGTKIFITSGHGKYHFVIARTEPIQDASDPLSGLKGLSMFLVPTYEDLPDGTRRRIVSLDRLEEKLGHHASVTAQLTFDQAPAQLIGKRGEGFDYMLLLMNGARVGVGFECIGLCEAATRLATGYAEGRRSMGKTIDQHEMIADYLDEMRTDTQAIRALCVYGAFHEEMAQKIQIKLTLDRALSATDRARLEKESKGHKQKARRVTPLLKYLGAEKAVEMARRGVQIHGGVGYTTEYGAEKLLRDAMVMPIYEGTSQIQSLMAMKDTLGGIMKAPGAFLQRALEARLRSLASRDELERGVARVQSLSSQAQRHLIVRTAGDKWESTARAAGGRLGKRAELFGKNWNPKRDFSFAMLHAERLTRILCDEAVCDLLWEQANKHPERREVLARYLERAEPRCRFLLDEIQSSSGRLLSQLSERALREAAE
jgi:alkylation response protein AidB-like acyl-CoA dehydrogenase